MNTTHAHARPTRVFTGLKPTGRLHLGNYLGAIRPLLDLANNPTHQVTVSVANLHALTITHDPTLMREQTIEMAATLLACGLPDHTRLFAQSAVPEYTELHYLLESTATYGEMHRMVQFREKSRSHGQSSHRLSLLTYPTLMAADILGSQADIVPVGEDQTQHLELTRTLAHRFNNTYAPVFTVPRGTIPPAMQARIKDLTDPTSKMGKTSADHHGTVFLLDDPDTIAGKVKRAVTDSQRTLTYEPEQRPGVATLATILATLTGRDPHETLTGLDGAATLKAAVTDALIDTLTPIRNRYRDIMNDPTTLHKRLQDDAEATRSSVAATVDRAREAMGLL